MLVSDLLVAVAEGQHKTKHSALRLVSQLGSLFSELFGRNNLNKAVSFPTVKLVYLSRITGIDGDTVHQYLEGLLVYVLGLGRVLVVHVWNNSD